MKEEGFYNQYAVEAAKTLTADQIDAAIKLKKEHLNKEAIAK